MRKDNCLEAMDKRQVEITYDNKWNEMDENAMANIHLALADNVLSASRRRKLHWRFGTISLNCMRPNHFTTRFSLRESCTLFKCLNPHQ